MSGVSDTSHGIYVVVDEKGNQFISYHPQTGTTYPTQYQQYSVNPKVFTQGPVSPTEIEFRLIKGQMQKITSVFFRFSIQNVSVAPITLLPGPMIFQRIDMFSGDTGKPLNTILSDALYTQYNLLPTEELNASASENALGIDVTDWATVPALAAGATAYYSIEILASIMNHIDPRTFGVDFIIQFIGESNIVTNGAAWGTNTDAEIKSISMQFTQRKDEMHEAKIATLLTQPSIKGIKMTYLDTVRSRESLNLQPGTEANSRINLRGRFEHLSVLIRASTLGTDRYTFVPISGGTNAEIAIGSIDIRDDNNKTLLGSGNMTPWSARNGNALTQAVKDVQSSVVPIYNFYFATDTHESFYHGIDTGSITIDSDLTLYITPGATFVGGTYDVLVLGWKYASASEVDGNIIADSVAYLGRDV